MGWAIGIDFGTSRSAGALAEERRLPGRASDGAIAVSPLEIEGNRWIASMVLRTPEGELVIGAAAENLAGVHPDRLERTPKRSLGSGAPLLLGGEAVDARDATAAVLRAIVAEGRLRSGGTEPDGVVLTHPVRWADVRRTALREAGERAGLNDVHLVEEPVAAAIHYAADHVAVGSHVGIYDLGGGTFDTAVLQRTADGFEVVGVPGGDEHIGGEDFDHRLFRYFGECLAETAPDVWEQVRTSDDRRWKRAALDLMVQARRAKEALSSYTSTQVFVPVADRDIVVNRSQFEAMIIDDIERTVDLMEETVTDAGLTIDDLTSVFLVGGSSRLPLVGQLVTERFGSRVVTRDEPKAVVALGAARLGAMRMLAARGGDTPPAASDATADGAPGASWLDGLPPPREEQRLDVPPADDAPQSLADLPPPAAPLATSPPATPQPLPPPALESLPPPTPLATTPAAAATQPVTVAWRLGIGVPPGQLAADIDAIAVGGPDGTVRCIDSRTGQLHWQHHLGVPIWAAPALADEVIAVGALDGRVAVLERRTGTVRWAVSTGSTIAAAPVIVGPMVVVANDGGRLLGLDRGSGALRWELPLGGAARSDLSASGGIVIATTADGHVFAVDAASGRCRWGYETGAAITTATGIVGDRVLVPCRDGVVHALRLGDGTAVYGIRCHGPCASGVATSRTDVAVVDESGVLHVHRADTGQAIVEVDIAAPQAAGVRLLPWASPTTAVIETGGGQLIAIDLATRTTRFAVPTGEENRSSPVASGGLVVVGTTFGQLYALVV